MIKGLNPLAALIMIVLIILIAWAFKFHPVVFLLLAFFLGGVLTYDNEEDFLYIKRELELKEKELGAYKQQEFLNPLDEDFKELLRLTKIANKRQLGVFDKAALHQLLEKYNH